MGLLLQIENISRELIGNHLNDCQFILKLSRFSIVPELELHHLLLLFKTADSSIQIFFKMFHENNSFRQSGISLNAKLHKGADFFQRRPAGFHAFHQSENLEVCFRVPTNTMDFFDRRQDLSLFVILQRLS